MADHWEFALGEARGEFVTVLGDDDALLPGAAEAADRILRATGARALRWEGAQYVWPSVGVPEVAGRLIIPLDPVLHRFWYRDVIASVANSRASFWLLPGPYTGLVHRDILGALQRHAGRVFAGSSPDLYAGFGCAYVLREYLSLGYPLSIWGASSASNGLNTFLGSGTSPAQVDFENLNAAAGLARDPRAPALPVLPAYVADMFWQAKARLFPSDCLLSVDRRRLCQTVVAGALANGGSESGSICAEVSRAASDDARLSRWLTQSIGDLLASAGASSIPRPAFGLSSKRIVVDSRVFGVTTIVEAAHFVSRLLGPPAWEPAPVSRATRRLRKLRRAADTAYRSLLSASSANIRPRRSFEEPSVAGASRR